MKNLAILVVTVASSFASPAYAAAFGAMSVGTIAENINEN